MPRKKQNKKEPCQANSSSTSPSGRKAMELKIDHEPPREDWESFSTRLIPHDDVRFVVKYHAYMLANVFKLKFVTNASTNGNATKKGRRVYVCGTGKYMEPYGTLDCDWKIILTKPIGQTLWYMETVTPTNCTCIHTCTSIDVITLINQPDFQLQIKKFDW